MITCVTFFALTILLNSAPLKGFFNSTELKPWDVMTDSEQIHSRIIHAELEIWTQLDLARAIDIEHTQKEHIYYAIACTLLSLYGCLFAHYQKLSKEQLHDIVTTTQTLSHELNDFFPEHILPLTIHTFLTRAILEIPNNIQTDRAGQNCSIEHMITPQITRI